MNKTTSLLICVLLFISACSTQPVENVEYFILSNGGAVGKNAYNSEQKPQVLIETVSIPQYLDTTNLAMQLSNHQLYYSKQHFWAEPLKTGIINALVEDLNGQESQNVYVAGVKNSLRNSRYRLGLRIQQFMPTDQSTVKLNGQYWLVEPGNDSADSKIYAFAYEVDLNQDGYAHSVSKMRALVTKLSQDILKNIEK